MNHDTMKSFSSFDPEIWDLLSAKLSDSRRNKMLQVAAHRSRYIRLALQDIYDPHNVSACLRSAEALGVLHTDLVNLYQDFSKPSTVARGSSNWLEIQRFKSIPDYVEERKSEGYSLAAGYPSAQYSLDELPLDRPLIVVFGNEHAGLSEQWEQHIDYKFSIPMVGMVESFNISVSAAICLYTLTQKALQSDSMRESFHMNEAEQKQLLAKWVSRHSRNLEQELAILKSRNR